MTCPGPLHPGSPQHSTGPSESQTMALSAVLRVPGAWVWIWCLVGAGEEGTVCARHPCSLCDWLLQASLEGREEDRFLLKNRNRSGRLSSGLSGAPKGGSSDPLPGLGEGMCLSWRSGGSVARGRVEPHGPGVHILNVTPGRVITPTSHRRWGRGVGEPPCKAPGKQQVLYNFPSSSSVTKVRPAWVPPPGAG